MKRRHCKISAYWGEREGPKAPEEKQKQNHHPVITHGGRDTGNTESLGTGNGDFQILREGSSRCGAAEVNPTSIHEDAGLIPWPRSVG